MKKVALLDDAITSNKIIENNICSSYYVNDELSVEEYANKISDTDTHSDTCAKIICKYAPDTEIYNIIVKDTDEYGDIFKLIAAIDFAAGLDVDIIHMSIGTVFRYYIRRLHKAVKEASKKSILVAARSNSGETTYPADFKEVVSCVAEGKDDARFNQKVNGKHIIRANNGKITVSPNTNSFAAAYYTALLCRNNNGSD